MSVQKEGKIGKNREGDTSRTPFCSFFLKSKEDQPLFPERGPVFFSLLFLKKVYFIFSTFLKRNF